MTKRYCDGCGEALGTCAESTHTGWFDSGTISVRINATVYVGISALHADLCGKCLAGGLRQWITDLEARDGKE